MEKILASNYFGFTVFKFIHILPILNVFDKTFQTLGLH